MLESRKPTASSMFPNLSWPLVSGDRLTPASMAGWRMLIVYRGAHCPLCKRYLKSLEALQADYLDAGIAVAALSADPEERAVSEAQEEGWTFPVGYGMSVEDMRTLDLYVSAPRSPEETDRDFAEPAVFVINPSGAIQIVDISNAPFARPDLTSLLSGLKFILANEYPIRGTA